MVEEAEKKKSLLGPSRFMLLPFSYMPASILKNQVQNYKSTKTVKTLHMHKKTRKPYIGGFQLVDLIKTKLNPIRCGLFEVL